MKKPKEIVRAEQLLALAAYNPEGEEARTAAMLLAKHIVRHGIVLTTDKYKQEPPPAPQVHYQPPAQPPPPPAPPRPRRRPTDVDPAQTELPFCGPKVRTRAPEQRKPKPQPKQRPRPDQEAYVFLVAKFVGKCMHCKMPINENDRIAWMSGAGATHEKCAKKYKWPVKPRETSDNV